MIRIDRRRTRRVSAKIAAGSGKKRRAARNICEIKRIQINFSQLCVRRKQLLIFAYTLCHNIIGRNRNVNVVRYRNSKLTVVIKRRLHTRYLQLPSMIRGLDDHAIRESLPSSHEVDGYMLADTYCPPAIILCKCFLQLPRLLHF